MANRVVDEVLKESHAISSDTCVDHHILLLKYQAVTNAFQRPTRPIQKQPGAWEHDGLLYDRREEGRLWHNRTKILIG